MAYRIMSHGPKPRISEDVRLQIKFFLKETDWSVQEIADECKVSAASVYRINREDE